MPSPSPLLEALDEVAKAVAATRHLLLFLDFDGTRAPTAEAPDLARLPSATRATLGRLARRADCTVSVVSGRALDDVRERVGIDGLVYAGNHDLEIAGGGLRFDGQPAVGLADETARAVTALTAALRGVDGALVEFKGLTASVHYRLVVILNLSAVYVAAGVLAVPVVLAARWASVAFSVAALGVWVRFEPGTIPVLAWGGLRGGILVALALSLPGTVSGSGAPVRDVIRTVTYAVVTFSILVQGLSIGPLTRRWLGQPVRPVPILDRSPDS